MSVVTGTLGLAALSSGYATRIISWSLEVEAPAQEVTAWDDYSSGLWRTFVAGARSWRGSFTCMWDPTEDILGALGSEVTLTLTVDNTGNGAGVSGTCQLVSISGSVDINTPGQVTFNFQGSGALTPDTSTS